MKTLALGKPDSQFYKSIKHVIGCFGEVVYKSEHEFPKVNGLVDFVKANAFDQVLMPNPYGNNKRLACYRKLKESKIQCICSDRGALPNSWFFDSGFNYDSESYNKVKWDNELSDTEKDNTEKYISNLVSGSESLEEQGARKSVKAIVDSFGLQGKKVVFVPMQRPDDTVIKHFFKKDMKKFVNSIDLISDQLKSISDDYVFLVKKHPLEMEYYQFSSTNVKYVPDYMHVNDLIELSDAILLINSGVGLIGLAYNKKVICMGDSFYTHEGLAVKANSEEEAVGFISSDSQVDYSKVMRFYNYLIHRFYSFGDFTTEKVFSGNSYRTETKDIKFKSLRILNKEINIEGPKILIVSPVVPYPIYRGSQQRVDGVIKWMIDNGYRVSLCILNTSFANKKSNELASELSSVYKGCENIVVIKDPKFDKVNKFNRIVKNISSKVYQSSRVVNSQSCPPKLIRTVKRMVDNIQPDHLLVNYVKCSAVIPKDYKGTKILDSHDYQTQFLEEDQQVNRANTHIKIDKFRASEHFWINKYDKVLSINPKETDFFTKNVVTGNTKVFTVPAFDVGKDISDSMFIAPPYHALFVGSVSNFNVSGLKWFLDEVLPLILEDMPDFRLVVAGNISRSKEIDKNKYSNVYFLGIVPDLKIAYQQAQICIAPILGGAGMKIKVIEAFSYGKPIVATSKALDGIDVGGLIDGKDKNIAFKEEVLKLLRDESYRSSVEGIVKDIFGKKYSVEAMSKSLRYAMEDNH